MTNEIVDVAVAQQIAPTPATLQRMGALVSLGATTTPVGDIALITQPSDYTAIIKPALAVTSITQVAGVATVTTTAAHGLPNGKQIPITISGAAPAAYNGTFLATVTGASTFTYAVPSGTASPATGTIKWQPGAVAEVQAMVNSWFAQGTQLAMWILELGPLQADDGVAALGDYLEENPNEDYAPGETGYFYAYCVPASFADEADYLDLVALYQARTAKTYFFTTMSLSNYTDFTILQKAVFGLVPAPLTPATEFIVAGCMYQWLVNRPSGTNKVPPFAFTYIFGATIYPKKGNKATLAAFKAAGVNYIGSGAEGGIELACLFYGTMMDKRGASYWYGIDWVQINVDLNISNAVINGSNSRVNPLYYNQQGIDRLQKIGANTMSSAVSFGLAVGTIQQVSMDADEFTAALNDGQFNGKLVINAIPFVPYSLANPGDYKEGEYDGFTVVMVSQNGFIHILFNVIVTDFVAQ